MGEIDWEKVEVVRKLMVHNIGTKFYEALVAWPLRDDGRIDVSKNALFITRYGKAKLKASGGVVGKGQCSGHMEISKLYIKTITTKENKGYVAKPTGDKVSIRGEDARNTLFELGYMMSHSGDTESIRLFLGQFKPDEGFVSKVIEAGFIKKEAKQIIRSPLFGSW